jgi:hypothetical protein
MIKDEKDRLYLALSFLTLSQKYLSLVRSVSDENTKQGNPHIIGTEIPSYDYEEATKWSDFNIGIPTLFNFYHGLELMLKGLLILKGDYSFMGNHSLRGPFKEFKKIYSGHNLIISILEEYLTINSMPDFLATCLKNNNVEIDKLYEFLRYPTDIKANKIYNYIDIKYKENKGLLFFRGLATKTDILIGGAAKLYRDEEERLNGRRINL